VARFEIPGELITLAPGTTTVVARFLGLTDSVVVSVALAAGGFGYFYSGDATAQDYDETFWTPLPGMGFTTAFSISAAWEVPYADHPEFGWIGSATPMSDVVLQAVSLDNSTCAAYVQPDTGFLYVTPGAPLVECRAPSFPPYRSSVRMEFLAFRPAEFTGTLGIVRPGSPPVSTTAGGIVETLATADSRAYAMPGVAPDSVFWFVTPGDWNVATCAMAPADVSAPQAAVRVTCNRITSDRFEPLFYAVGFGPDARRGTTGTSGTTPIGFFEVSSAGAITRKVVDGLDITTSRSSPGTVDAIVSGARIAAFDRVPAILVTAIAPSAMTCGITEPVRQSPTTVKFTVTCPDNASGFTLGILY
jgi:hypothetical protein